MGGQLLFHTHQLLYLSPEPAVALEACAPSGFVQLTNAPFASEMDRFQTGLELTRFGFIPPGSRFGPGRIMFDLHTALCGSGVTLP